MHPSGRLTGAALSVARLNHVTCLIDELKLTEQPPNSRQSGRYAMPWHAFWAWRHGIDAGTRRALSLLLTASLVVYFIFCALFLALRYAVLPNIDVYKPQIEAIATKAIGRKVAIGTIHATWRGLNPHLTFTNVHIHNRQGEQALSLPRIAATVSWWSVTAADLRLETLEVIRPDLDIERDKDGNFYVAGILIERERDDEGKGLDWLLSQREIVIRDGWLRWNDAMRDAPELVLNDVDFVLHNQWRYHRFALRATPPEQLAAPIDVRADFVHPVFTRKISDFRQWKGTLYGDWRNTDLAVWKTYFDYPFEVQQGVGAVRAWLSFDHARIVDFTADLTLSNVSARLRKDLQVLSLAQVRGRVSASEAAGKVSLLSFGSQGHTVSLQDFSFETKDGFKLPETTITHTSIAATKKAPEKTKIEAKALDLRTLSNFVGHLPLTRTQLQMLADFAPRGNLKDFSAEWQGAYPDISAYKVKGRFEGLSLNAQAPRPARPRQGKVPAQAAVPGIPGFENLTGSVDASDQGGNFNLASRGVSLNLPGYFSDPVMPFDKLDMQASWDLKDKTTLLLQIDSMDFVQEGAAGSLKGKHWMPLLAQAGKPLGTVDLSAKISTLDLNRIGRYLPVGTPVELRDWLTGALQGGRVKDVSVNIKGDVAGIPFQDQRLPDKLKGQFAIAGKIENGILNYAPGHFGRDGKAPFWPLLEEINGSFSVDRARMQIHADSAKTFNVQIADVDALIPNLLSADNVLEITGSADGALQDFVGYVNNSPVAAWIADFTEETKGAGDAKLALKLQLPLHQLKEAKVQGRLQFLNNNIVLQNAIPLITGASGELAFHEKGFALNGVKAGFLGGAAAISGGTQRDGTTSVRVEGNMSSDGLRKAYPTPVMQRLLQQIVGGTRYAAVINVKKQHPEILVESGLQGIALNFPVPLRKAANESLPLRFELTGRPSNDTLKLTDEIHLSLGNAIAAHYVREKLVGKQESWKMVRGGIGVNVPAPQPEDGLVANVSLQALNIDAWRMAVAGITGNEDEARKAQKSAEPDPTSLGIDQYIEPQVLAARAKELYVMGKKLDNVIVGASNQNGNWQANIDSEQASGYVSWEESRSGRGLGKVTARLASLTIPQSAASDVSELLEGKASSTAQIPALDIVAENFQLFGKNLGQLELAAHNASGAEGREWRIRKLSLINPDASFKAAGKWGVGTNNLTNLTYALDIADAGKLLNRFGFVNVLRGGKGRMDGDISWKGMPFAIDIPSMNGRMHLDMAAGQFLKVDPGAAKLLGVFSLQSLPRRLALDFRDVFSEGFAFDSVVGTGKIAQGILTTDNFKMRSLNAVVLMDGDIDIAKEAQELHVVIIPEINAGAASVVYGLVVNPVIGLGSFLAQLFLRDPLMRALTMEYQISGSWKDPEINKIPRTIGRSNPESSALSLRRESVVEENG
jgi:uncharacterized protein (TIGR02099 family)